MNNRGFLRIVEASIAIVIIMGVLFVVFAGQRAEVTERADLADRARAILEELSLDNGLRTAVLTADNDTVNAFVRQRVPENFLSFEVQICDVADVCGRESFTEGEIYSAERVISSTLETHSPMKVRLFLWEDTP